MDKLRFLFIAFGAALIISCGGSSDDCTGTIAGQCGSTGNPDDPTIASVELTSSLPTLPSDQSGSKGVDLSARVLDLNNNGVEGVDVTFSATSGQITEVDNGLTNASGVATARLTSGSDASNRTITVTAAVGSISSMIDVDVTGTTLSLTGATSVGISQSTVYDLVLTDSEGAGIASSTISIASSSGNALSPAGSVDTGTGGTAQFTYTPTVTGADTLTAAGSGAADAQDVTVTNNQFEFTTPLQGDELTLSPDSHPITINFVENNVAVTGATIIFGSTRGTLDSNIAVTAGGAATVNLTSSTIGPVTITATDQASGATATVNAEFVATTPTKIALEVFPTTIVPGQETTLTATVRDANDNRVKNVPVNFNITSDSSIGDLAFTQAQSDSNGQAKNFFRAGDINTAEQGVTIEAGIDTNGDFVDDLTAEVSFTVAGNGLFFVLGSGNSLFEIDETRYGMPWSITVTDAVGAPVANQSVQASILSTDFDKGTLFWNALAANPSWVEDLQDNCPDEDSGVYNDPGKRNGILDNNGDGNEDLNGNGSIDAGNVATIVPGNCTNVIGGGTNQTVLDTDNAGTVLVCVVYPQSYSGFVSVELAATAPVEGTEYRKSTAFELPRYAPDFNDSGTAPPANYVGGIPTSPFGGVPGCDNTN